MRETYAAPPASAACTLEALAKLRGTVVDGDDEPVSGATVSLAALQEEITTQKAGTFTLHDLEPGTYTLSVAAPGLSGRTVDLELAAGDDRDLGRLELAPGRDLWARVLDAETGEPVAGARVEILEPRGGGRGVSDDAGDVRLQTGSHEILLLETRASGYAPKRDEVDPEALDGGEAVPLELFRAGYLEVRAWRPDGSPCSGCTISVLSHEIGSTSLELDGDGHARSGELPPGDYQATLVRERSFGQVIQVSGGDNVRWAKVEPECTTTVRFGEPAETVRVVLGSPLPPGWTLRAQGPGWNRSYDTGAEFEVRRQPGEPVRLSLQGPGIDRVELAEIPGDFDRDTFRVEVPGAAVGGVLMPDDGVEIGPMPLRLREAAGGGIRATVRPTPDGSFRIPFVPPGTYTLLAGNTPLATFAVAPGRFEDLGELSLR